MLRRNLTRAGTCKYQAKYKRAVVPRCKTTVRERRSERIGWLVKSC